MSKKITKTQLKKISKKIEEELHKMVYANISDNSEFKTSQEELSDEVDKAMADIENAQKLRFRNRENFYVKKLNLALEKIAREEYGDCKECGDHIRFERLWARPTAELCIQCKEESERDESSNFFGRQSKSLGKTINLVPSL